MKKYLLILFTVGLFTGCDKYDDGKLWDNINNLEARLTALEKQCKEMNTNIESMKVIVDVLQSNDYVTNVTVVSENGVEIGYKIDFHVHPSITIYHGKEGSAGETPYVGENGNWCQFMKHVTSQTLCDIRFISALWKIVDQVQLFQGGNPGTLCFRFC